MKEAGKMSHRFTRRTLLSAAPAAAATSLFPELALADFTCSVEKQDGKWRVKVVPIVEQSASSDTKTENLEIVHTFDYGTVSRSDHLVSQPELGFSIELRTAGDRITGGKIDVSALAYTDRAVVTLRDGKSDIHYWAGKDGAADTVQRRISYRQTDRIYFQITAANGQSVRMEGGFSPGARGPYAYSKMDAPVAEFFLDASFDIDNHTIGNQISYFLRRQSPVTIETGVIRQDSMKIAFMRETLDTEDFEKLYVEALAEFNANFASGTACGVYERDFEFDHCFLTTACCAVQGRPDDCLELQTLRRFRDKWLLRQPFGAGEIAHYYRVAPNISGSLLASREGRKKLRNLYWRTIMPCVAMIWIGWPGMAYRLYKRMMIRLAAE
ncbi:CFI-box-CTERM domain-containing protein [Falsochrobactrum shanghaiense]|uniref:CFI-box-CTERM domain-containing protein n=1 Tax=Falsochrobactrum shanghaiense TaxID=2201899 RepID=UPI0011B2724D|nr:CFI-box-CTERM domain-containing protein [Falsochrobactrum shanghaiense]